MLVTIPATVNIVVTVVVLRFVITGPIVPALVTAISITAIAAGLFIAIGGLVAGLFIAIAGLVAGSFIPFT